MGVNIAMLRNFLRLMFERAKAQNSRGLLQWNYIQIVIRIVITVIARGNC